MTQKNRIRTALTITLSPETMEALDILKELKSTKNVSYLVDHSVKSFIETFGYKFRKEEVNTINNDVRVSLIRGGKELVKYSHEGQDFVSVPAEKSTYTIELKNNSNKRKLVVIAVDGRNVMTGELATKNDEGGYVIAPYQAFNLKGWRRTADEVAAFEFVDLEASYDKQVGGEGSNVGVIGVAVYDEKEILPILKYWEKPYGWAINNGTTKDYTPTAPDFYLNSHQLSSNLIGSNENSFSRSRGPDSIATSSCDSDSLCSETIGTGYGERTEMKTTSTTFEKASLEPSQVIVLRYAVESTLRKWGVIKESIIPKVNPFPKEKIAVPAPPGWKS